MGMMSKQELDINVKVLLDKVEFIMKSFNVAQQNPLNPLAPPIAKSLLQVYYEVRHAGVTLAESVGDVIDTEAVNEPKDESNVSVDEGCSERQDT